MGTPPAPASVSVIEELLLWGKLVKFSHSVFALPFALSMFVVASREVSVTAGQLAWILLALVSARSAAMAFNRLVDRDLDAANPRTSERELPSGKLSPSQVKVLIVFSSAVFILSSGMLGRHCLELAPLVLAILFFYSWTKRFTAYAHLVLGTALALAPGGVWYALTARLAFEPVILMLAVAFWVSGFDILYSLQDMDFDRAKGLHSIPSKLGLHKSFWLARVLHLLSLGCLIWYGGTISLGAVYFTGLALFGYLLLNQHLSISPQALGRIDAVFFTRNGLASLVFFGAVLLDHFFKL